MKVTITNDDGEVYAILTDVHLDTRKGRFVGTDEEGEVTLVSGALHSATIWQEQNKDLGWFGNTNPPDAVLNGEQS